MSRRLAFALLTAAFLVAAPATASAQAPLDERANARTFADVGLRLAGAFDTASEALSVGLDAEPACLSERLLARRLARAPKRKAAPLYEVEVARLVGDFARTLEPAFLQGLSDMHAVQTADPALRGGRTAWRRIHRVYAGFGALPVADFCTEARAFVRSRFHSSPAMRRAHRAIATADHTGGIDRRLERAVKRLEELGVPAADANLFDGPFSDE